MCLRESLDYIDPVLKMVVMKTSLVSGNQAQWAGLGYGVLWEARFEFVGGMGWKITLISAEVKERIWSIACCFAVSSVRKTT